MGAAVRRTAALKLPPGRRKGPLAAPAPLARGENFAHTADHVNLVGLHFRANISLLAVGGTMRFLVNAVLAFGVVGAGGVASAAPLTLDELKAELAKHPEAQW